MYDNNPIWRRYYLSRRVILFLKHYSETLLFKISSPLSSVFWISSSLASKEVAPSIKVIAVLTLIAPSLWFFVRNRPFNVQASWEQLRPTGKEAERANYRNSLYIDDEATNEIRVRLLFDESVDSYSIRFNPDYPLSVYPTDRPNNSEYDPDANILSAEEVDNVRFFLILRVDSERDLNVYEPEIKIIDDYNYDLGIVSNLPNCISRFFRSDTVLMNISIY